MTYVRAKTERGAVKHVVFETSTGEPLQAYSSDAAAREGAEEWDARLRRWAKAKVGT